MVNILIIDNIPELLKDMEWVVKKWGAQEEAPKCKVDVARNPKVALALIQANDYDIIIVDIRLRSENDDSDKSGFEILEAAKAKDPFVQVIVVTSFPDPKLGTEAMSRGAFDYLERNAPGPAYLDELVPKIRQAIAYRRRSPQKRATGPFKQPA